MQAQRQGHTLQRHGKQQAWLAITASRACLNEVIMSAHHPVARPARITLAMGRCVGEVGQQLNRDSTAACTPADCGGYSVGLHWQARSGSCAKRVQFGPHCAPPCALALLVAYPDGIHVVKL